MLKGRTIVLGVTGGIASYKAVTLCSMLVKAGADVKVVMTASATKFVTPLTFQTMSRNYVYTDTFEERDPSGVSHIDLADSADLVVIAPATANMIAKLTHGLADDMLSTTLLATTAPIWMAPAMNVHMYAHPAVQQNMKVLEERGVRFIEPGEGLLACGYTGKGRLAEPDQIYEQIVEFFQPSRGLLAGKRVIVTAGGTVERIDPVRYLTNDSSGKMGIAVAEAARDMGAHVTLVAGNVSVPFPSGVTVVSAESTEQMYEEVMKRFDEADLVVKAAAVADYRPEVQLTSKMKKHADELTLKLVKNPDILAELGARKKQQFIIGFAAETDDLYKHAMDKLNRKNCDLIAANDVSAEGAGFGSDTNVLHLFSRDGLVQALPMMSKRKAAEELLALAAQQMERKRETDDHS